ncbi:MAG: hypothetical protein IJ168_04605 [Eubacterium sp.]|nr:hypothetical protein [Eubacterium sp.]
MEHQHEPLHAHDGCDCGHDHASEQAAHRQMHHHADVHEENCHCGCGADHGESYGHHKKAQRTKIVLSAVFFAAGWVLSELTALPEVLALLCYLVAYVAVGFSVVREALEDITHGNLFGECFLISVASLGAIVIGDYGEDCAVMLLFAIGEYIQGAALYRSRSALKALAQEHGFSVPHANSDTERFISKFAKIYTPIICALALVIVLVPPLLLGGEWKEWVYRGLSALVIGCPCAIVISVPLAFSCAMSACTKNGIFVHCSDALERLHKSRSGEFAYTDEIMIPDGDGAKLQFAMNAAKKAVIIARENVVFALAVKLVILVLAVFMDREVPIWLAEFGDIGVAILAILNSLRAARIKK